MMTLAALAQLLLAVTLALAGALKLARPAGFRQVLTDLKLLPAPLVRLATWAVPASEVAAAGLLLWERTRGAGSLLTFALLGAFAIATVRALTLKEEVACHCFGELVPEAFGLRTVARLAVLAALNGYVLVFEGPTGLGAAPLAEHALAAGCVVGVLLLYAVGSALYEYLRAWRAPARGSAP